MVFIDERNAYLSGISDQPKLKSLYSLLWDGFFQVPTDDFSEADNIYYASIQAIKEDSKDDFQNQYSKISKRKVTKSTSAPFVHDDFLLFILIVGVLKFGCSKEWLLGVAQNRAKNPTTTTFENILNGDYQSKANNQSLVLIFLYLLDKAKITNEKLIEAYEEISSLKQSHKNDLIRIIHYRAFDLIIQFKLPRDKDQIAHLLEFEKKFKKRINTFSYLTYNALLLLLLVGTYQVLHALPEDWKSKINEIGIIIGIGGVGLFGNIIPKCKTKFQELILSAFGHENRE